MRPFAFVPAILLFAGSVLAAEAPKPAQPAPDLSTATAPRPGDRMIGNPDAKVTIVEYASLTCSHCAAFHTGTLPALKAKWIDTGKAKLIYRDFPLDRGALAAAVVARCISPADKSLGYVAALFETQGEWTRAAKPIEALAERAAPFGLDAAAFKRCIEDDKDSNIRPVIEIAQEAQEKFGVDATPSFIIGGEKISGGLTAEEFDAVLAPLAK